MSDRAPWGISNRDDALAAVDDWLSLLDLAPWRGQSGSTDRAVAEAVGRWAKRRGGVRFAAGIDEVAIEAGVHYATAARSLKRLAAARWVRVATPPTATRATVWLLTLPDEHVDAYLNGTYMRTARDACDDLGADWARWDAIGKTGVRIWRACRSGASTAQLAAQFGLSERTIRYHLRRLKAFGAVHSNRRVWYADDVRDVVAEWFRTDGARQRQQAALEQRRRVRRSGSPVQSERPTD